MRGGSRGVTRSRPAAGRRRTVWQAEFPWQNLLTDGWRDPSPVGSFEPNGYGLLDMTSNVWKRTSDTFDVSETASHCCAHQHPAESSSRPVISRAARTCAPNSCLRFRPAARQSETIDTSTGHIGFRCVVRDA